MASTTLRGSKNSSLRVIKTILEDGLKHNNKETLKAYMRTAVKFCDEEINQFSKKKKDKK